MNIFTSTTNQDMITTIDNLHPIKQIEYCEKFKNDDITITTYSTYIIEWASINDIDILCDSSMTEIYDSINAVFDILDDMSIKSFKGKII